MNAVIAKNEAIVRQGDERAKHELEVEGVPFFIFDNKFAVSGAQDASVLLKIFAKLQLQ